MKRWQAQHVLDLGDGHARAKPLPGIAERDISAPVKKLLAMHRNVALAVRTNSGAGYMVPAWMMDAIIEKIGVADFREAFGRPHWIELAPEGCSDYVGLLRDSRMLALEVKKQKYVPSDVDDGQRAFLQVVNAHGGLGFVGSDTARIEAILSGRIVPEDRGGFLA